MNLFLLFSTVYTRTIISLLCTVHAYNTNYFAMKWIQFSCKVVQVMSVYCMSITWFIVHYHCIFAALHIYSCPVVFYAQLLYSNSNFSAPPPPPPPPLTNMYTSLKGPPPTWPGRDEEVSCVTRWLSSWLLTAAAPMVTKYCLYKWRSQHQKIQVAHIKVYLT